MLVRNITHGVDKDKVQEECAKYGQISDVHMPLDFNTRRPKGFAFVEFADETEGRACIEKMDGQDFEGRVLQVCQAKQKRMTSDQMRHRDGMGGPPRGGGGDGGGGYGRRSPPRVYGVDRYLLFLQFSHALSSER